jgi:hypothetical protein
VMMTTRSLMNPFKREPRRTRKARNGGLEWIP